MVADGSGTLDILGNQVTIDVWVKLENAPTRDQEFSGFIGKGGFPMEPYEIAFESGPIVGLPQNQWLFEYILTNAGGTRVQMVVLDSGEVIVRGGTVLEPDRTLNVATPDFTARGGDDYPFRGAKFTRLLPSYQLGLANYISAPEGLNGQVSAADYPVGGEGRIKRLP